MFRTQKVCKSLILAEKSAAFVNCERTKQRRPTFGPQSELLLLFYIPTYLGM